MRRRRPRWTRYPSGLRPTTPRTNRDVEGWLQLTCYAGDAAAKARALRCPAVDTLTEAGETLGAAQVLVAVKPPDLARLGRLREAQGRPEDAAETHEVAEMPADALRNWRAAGKWERAVRLAEGEVRSDLEWLVELEALTRRRPADQRKRLTAGERERLVQLMDSVERLPRSGRTAAAATALPLVILPALGPGLPPGFVEADGMPPVPDKARTGRFFGRRVMEFQNWTLASNARWRLTDEQLALLWQAEFPNSRARYTMKSVRTVRNLFNQGRRNNERPPAPVPEYDPAGIRWCSPRRTSEPEHVDAVPPRSAKGDDACRAGDEADAAAGASGAASARRPASVQRASRTRACAWTCGRLCRSRRRVCSTASPLAFR